MDILRRGCSIFGLVGLLALGRTGAQIVPPETTYSAGMAQVASGGGWQTIFTIVNTGRSATQAELSFFDDNGEPLLLPLTFLNSGTETTASSLNRTIAAGGTLVVATDTTDGHPVVGSALLTSTDTVSGSAIFRYNPTGQEAIVPLETRNAGSYTASACFRKRRTQNWPR